MYASSRQHCSHFSHCFFFFFCCCCCCCQESSIIVAITEVSFQFRLLLRIYYAFQSRAIVYLKFSFRNCMRRVEKKWNGFRSFSHIVSRKKLQISCEGKIIWANLMLNCFYLRECIVEVREQQQQQRWNQRSSAATVLW